MFVTVVALKYALLVSRWSCGHFHKVTDSVLFESHDKSSPFNATHYACYTGKNGDRTVTIDSLTPLHPVCTPTHCWTGRSLDQRIDAVCGVDVCSARQDAIGDRQSEPADDEEVPTVSTTLQRKPGE